MLLLWLRAIDPMRIRRPRPSQDASRGSEDDVRALALQRSVNRLARLFRERVVPSEKQLDVLAEVTDADVESAVSFWNDSQDAADTGLRGLLDAKVNAD